MVINKLLTYLSNFRDKNILVVGDIIVDEYTKGNVTRISKEAPVPIVEVYGDEYLLGGASNVAHNLLTLSSHPYLYGAIGDDITGNHFLDMIKTTSHFGENIKFVGIKYSERATTKKTRVISKKHQILRLDREITTEIKDANFLNGLIGFLSGDIHFDAIVVSDYAKGVITKPLMSELRKYSKATNTPLIVDVRPQHREFYKNVFLITPNKEETETMVGYELITREDIEKAGVYLVDHLDCNVIITRGEGGMSVFEKGKAPLHLSASNSLDVSDVSGAGDTVVATISLAISSGASLEEAAILSNYSGGIEVSKFGTSPVHINELEKRLISEINRKN